MANTLKLEIVTPEAKIFSDDVDMVTLTGVEGEMGILPNHVPLMTQLCRGRNRRAQGGGHDFPRRRRRLCADHRRTRGGAYRHGHQCRQH
jgi:hypothetical protein